MRSSLFAISTEKPLFRSIYFILDHFNSKMFLDMGMSGHVLVYKLYDGKRLICLEWHARMCNMWQSPYGCVKNRKIMFLFYFA